MRQMHTLEDEDAQLNALPVEQAQIH